MKRSVAIRAITLPVIFLCACLPVGGALANIYVAKGDLYDGTTDAPAILVFAGDAVGDAAPIRTIAGEDTGLLKPTGLVVDNAHNELLVADCYAQGVLVFPLNANGNVAPTRKIVHADSQAGVYSYCPRHVALDAVHDEIVVTQVVSERVSGFTAVYTFSRTASGFVQPLRQLVSTDAQTKIEGPYGVVVDTAHDEILVDSGNVLGSLPGVLSFSRLSTGNTPPLRTLAGVNTLMSYYSINLAFDAAHDEIYADAYRGQVARIAAYPRVANGNAAPLRSISGDNTAFSQLTDTVFDDANQRLLVLDGNFIYHNYDLFPVQNILAFKRDASGEPAPVATLGGATSGLRNASAIAIDAQGGLSGRGARAYFKKTVFDGDAGNPSSFIVEDFAQAQVASGHSRICGRALNASTNDTCFSPGQLREGFSITTGGGNATSAVAANVFGNDSAVVGPLLSGDTTTVTFSEPTAAFALDLYARLGDGQTAYVLATVYDVDGHVSTQRRWLSEPDAKFFIGGVKGDRALSRVDLRILNDGGVVLIDNLRLRADDGFFADSFEP